jgi:hypothetical protein
MTGFMSVGAAVNGCGPVSVKANQKPKFFCPSRACRNYPYPVFPHKAGRPIGVLLPGPFGCRRCIHKPDSISSAFFPFNFRFLLFGRPAHGIPPSVAHSRIELFLNIMK